MSSGALLFRYFLSATLISCTLIANAQDATIQGTIKNTDGQNLSEVTVLLVGTGTGTSSDKDGYYQLKVPALQRLAISFSSIGYDSLVFTDIQLEPNETRSMDITLTEKPTILNQVEVVTEPYRREVSIVKITPRSVRFLPSAFGDFSKILSTLPGVVTNNEFSTAYSVRGGNFDENLVYINGFKVYRPFLVRAGRQEGLGVVNTDLTREAKFFAGGWNASYGDRLSSVLDVDYIEPVDFHGSLTLGLLGGSAHLEGATADNRFSYLVGARNKRGKYLLNTLEVEGEYFPNFTDVQGYFNYKLNPERTDLGLFLSYAGNRYRVEPETRETEFGTFNQALRFLVAFDGEELLNYDTWQGGLKLNHKLRPDKTLTISASGVKTWEKEYSDLEGGYRLCDVDKNPGSASFNECISTRGIGTDYFHARNTLEGTLFNADLQIEQTNGSGSYLQYGLGYDYNTFDDYLEEYSFIDSADYVRIIAQNFTTSQTDANIFSGYFQHTLPTANSGEFQYGLRVSYRDLNEQWLISPRLQYSFQPEWERDYIFKIATGIYQQNPLYREMRSYDGTLNTGVKAQKSAQLIIGLDHNFFMWERPFKWTVETYYKYMWDVIPYDVDNVRVRYSADNIAVAYATGLDTRLSGEFIPGTESWFSMSILSTKEDIENDDKGYIRRPTDQRLTLSTYFEDHLPDNPSLRVNLGLVFGSGLPFGPPNNFEDRVVFSGRSYTRVDVGFSKIVWDRTGKIDNFLISLEILNLLGSQNVISYTWIQDISGTYLAIPNTLSNRFFNLKLSVRI